jgi:hypothetical protein
MSNEARDRRQLNRFRSVLSVRLRLNERGTWVPGFLHDVSPGGANIRTGLTLEPGGSCQILVQPPPAAGLSEAIIIFAQCIRHVGDKMSVQFDRSQLAETSILLSAIVDSGLADGDS